MSGRGSKNVVILQPGYLPWIGFFDLMHKADVFVIYDDVQYTVRDWRSRNRIKTPDGVVWLTVPVMSKGVSEKLIKDVEIADDRKWQTKHLNTIRSYYKRAQHFEAVMEQIADIYARRYRFLIDLDMDFIMKVKRYLSLEAEILFSSKIPSAGKKDEKILSICEHLGATNYISGNAAKAYLREEIFERAGIRVQWHDYVHPHYNQLWVKENGFVSHLTVLDLLLNHGPDSRRIITGELQIPKPEGLLARTADELMKG